MSSERTLSIDENGKSFVNVVKSELKARLSNRDLPERLHEKHFGYFPKHIDPI